MDKNNVSLTGRVCCFIALLCLFSGVAMPQEQFEKRFSILFDKTPLREVVASLAKTQTEMPYYSDNDSIWNVPVTLDLKNVTLDEALDKVLATQKFFKDYMVTDYGTFTELELLDEKSDVRYFNRKKNPGRFYHIGDQLPDSAYTIANYRESSVRLSGLKKKLIILDIWGIHCSSCIASMPGMQKIQEEFADQVQIILVSRDSHQQVELLKKSAPYVKNTRLPFITGENVLPSLFDLISNGTQIWIDDKGVIQYITNKDINKEKYIRDFLAGVRMPLAEAKDTFVDANYDVPMANWLQPVNGGKFTISSYLAPHEGNKYSFYVYIDGPREQDTVKMLSEAQTDLFSLYKLAYGFRDRGAFSNTRVIKNYPDPKKYDPDIFWGKNYYDYELITKIASVTNKKFYALMRSQLDTYFDVKSSVQKRKVPCFILQRAGKTDALKTRGGNPYCDHEGNTVLGTNTSLDDVVKMVNSYRLDKWPVVNGTGLDPRIKVDWRVDLDFEQNLPAMQKSLAALGLTLTKGERVMDCIVLDGK